VCRRKLNKILSYLLQLETLVMSSTGVVTVANDAFSPLSKLVSLDLRATPLTDYESGVFGGLLSLRELYADDPKLCCSYFLPDAITDLDLCSTPRVELSSCNDLLHNDFFRTFLWIFAVLAIVGNAGVFLYRYM
jgi:hypothetical protein